MGYYAYGGGSLQLKCNGPYEAFELEKALKSVRGTDCIPPEKGQKLVTAIEVAEAVAYLFSGYSVKQDGDCVLVSGEYEYSKWYDDEYRAALESIAERCESGLIEFQGDDEISWRYVFKSGHWVAENGETFFPSDHMIAADPLLDKIEEMLKAHPADSETAKELISLREYVLAQIGE